MTSAWLLALLPLAGCTNYYLHPDAGRRFEPDLYECQKDAAPVNNPARHDDMIDRCLRVKGWQPTHPSLLERLNKQ